MKKDKRVSYSKKLIEVNGTKVYFDGKGNPETKLLKVYRYYGNINIIGQAMDQFCKEYKYTKCKLLFLI
jgi:hypothetical protein